MQAFGLCRLSMQERARHIIEQGDFGKMQQQAHDSWFKSCWMAGVALLAACGDSAPPPAPAPEIEVVAVIQRDTNITQDFVGQTRGSTDIPIRARVEGFLETRTFQEGGEVKKDQVLYTIDPLPFKAKVIKCTVFV